MNDIIEKTRELGELIKSCPQMAKLKEAEAKQAEDEDAKTLMLEFNMNRMNLGRDIQSGKITEEDAVRKNNEAFQKLVSSNDSIREYVEAKNELDKVVSQVNAILNFYITGQAPGGCTHDCASCGGC